MENAVVRRDAGTKVDLFRNVDAVRHVPFFSFLFLSFSLFFKKKEGNEKKKTRKIFLFHFHIWFEYIQVEEKAPETGEKGRGNAAQVLKLAH